MSQIKAFRIALFIAAAHLTLSLGTINPCVPEIILEHNANLDNIPACLTLKLSVFPTCPFFISWSSIAHGALSPLNIIVMQIINSCIIGSVIFFTLRAYFKDQR
jgi:hypothetical protein